MTSKTTSFRWHGSKKIMKSDEDVRMISAEAPVLFSKACEMFILELTLRSWIHTEENKRRTLQRNDIAAAISKTDIFDFLIDIVPREDVKPVNKLKDDVPGVAGVMPGAVPRPMPGVPMTPEQMQYFVMQQQMAGLFSQQMAAGRMLPGFLPGGMPPQPGPPGQQYLPQYRDQNQNDGRSQDNQWKE
mmetsp:Transcript_19841/g.34142  ORF Transcript_19841/g.34142 Transcript_19841/m.34142 type:complete len:187 (-) Transcript_19841:890-1450(-)